MRPKWRPVYWKTHWCCEKPTETGISQPKCCYKSHRIRRTAAAHSMRLNAQDARDARL